MKGKNLSWKRYLVVMAILLLVGAFLGSTVFAAEKIVLKKYPDMKIGFTTQNFLQPLPVSLENAKKLVDWASAQGFAWIEYRDPSAKLTLNECKQLAAYAKGKKLEVSYAAQIGILDPEFWEIFYRGVSNAAVFEGPKTFRTLIAGAEFNPDPKKMAWSLDELSKLVKKANMAANIAKSKDVQYVAENSTATLKGDGITSFGTTEFFANVNSNMGWQMDTANFFAGIRVLPKPEQAQAFLEKNIGKLFYVHVKSSSREHKSTDILEENELPFDVIFPLLSKNKVNYLALELNQQPKLEDCQNNLMKSIEFLKKNY
jgi:sugar phosphate isomerase/epimerase